MFIDEPKRAYNAQEMSVMLRYLQALDGQSQHTWCEFRSLLKCEITPVDDQHKSINLELCVFNHGLQGQQNGSQYIHKGVSKNTDQVLD